jgi:hypothetical protein
MTDLEPASALAVRIAEDCYQPVDNWDSGDSSSFDREKCAELIESDRAAVREAALREAVGVLQVHRDALGLLANQTDDYASRQRLLIENEQVGSMQRLIEKLLTEKRTP